jgi:hypothetical protein
MTAIGCRRALGLVLASMGLATSSWAEDAPGGDWLWSATLFGQLHAVESDQDDDGVTGFFDQYEFTPNKDSVSLELGVREASLDWVVERAPLLQLRYASPTSNLGITGSDFDDAFFNQRALLLGRLPAFAFDVDYRRLRTERLRVFPDTSTGGAALPFTDLSGRDNRFYRERTGFDAELRWRPGESLGGRWDELHWLGAEVALRGGYEARDTRTQTRTILNPGNDWLSFSQDRGDEVADVGAGILLAPAKLVTLTLDFDHEDFSSDNAELDTSLPFASTGRSVGFVPSSRRNTGRVQLHGRIGERAVVTAGFQASFLEQEDPDTPAQRGAGFGENEVNVLSAQVSGDLQLTQDLAGSAYFKLVHRDRDIDRSSALFGPTNGTQVDELLETYQRIDVGAEARYRPHRRVKTALGLRLHWIDRDLDFARAGLGNRVILPANALVEDETMMWTLYGRADLRPLRGLGVRGELSYRGAPDTGYITDLDDYVEGKLRVSYIVPISRPASLALFIRGGTGENSDFSMVEGLGPLPPGPGVGRDYERSHWTLGVSGDLMVRDDTTLFGSFYYSQDQQSDDLLLSNLQRYFQESVPITFRAPGGLDFQSDELSLVLGAQLALTESSNAGVAYSFTRAEADYGKSGGARELRLVDDNRIVDADIHTLDLELRHRVRDGLRVFAGYRLQYYSDGAPKPASLGSAIRPPDRSDVRHTVSLGVTLTSDLLERR